MPLYPPAGGRPGAAHHMRPAEGVGGGGAQVAVSPQDRFCRGSLHQTHQQWAGKGAPLFGHTIVEKTIFVSIFQAHEEMTMLLIYYKLVVGSALKSSD